MGVLQAYLTDVVPPFGAAAFGESDKSGAAHTRCTEWAIVQKAIAGDIEAQEHLFARHRSRLYKTAVALLRNKEDAEDAVQDGLCNAYTHLRSFQGRSSFSTWLTSIVINSALMSRRRRRAHPEASLDDMLETLLRAAFLRDRRCTIESRDGLFRKTTQRTPGQATVAAPTIFESGISAACDTRFFSSGIESGSWYLRERGQSTVVLGAKDVGTRATTSFETRPTARMLAKRPSSNAQLSRPRGRISIQYGSPLQPECSR